MIQTFSKGIIDENPVCVYLLGLCPVLAVSTRVIDAFAMGLTLLVILVITSTAMSAVKDHIPGRFRVFVCTAVAGACASMADLIMQAAMPGLSDRLGIFVPLITVNTLILDRALGFAQENTPSMSFWDALGMGCGFFLTLLGVALIREVLGSGTITLVPVGRFSGVIRIPALSESPVRVISLSAGGFLVLGYLKAVFDLAAPATIKKSADEEEK
ncbi:MAG: electron transport complex subunit RsxE [Spirochaetales bacterium]|jgi:electron transport complex protein RnfE|nr:electron transport complex subunit RsxE [Spirochaetales bacterium]